jgi:hypothetical protein
MSTKKQILKFNIIMGIVLLISIITVLVLVWGKQVWFFYGFIIIDYGSYNFVTGEGPWMINFPLFMFIADLLGNIYLWSRLPRENKGLPIDDLRL